MPPLIVETNPASSETLQNRAQAMIGVEEMCKSQIQWHQCSTVAEYRKMRSEGTNGFPKPLLNERAKVIAIKRRAGNEIELRIIRLPAPTKVVLLHFHAGGLVIGSAKSYDIYLLRLATALELTVVSVEYRLAPENPYPAGHNDCLDAAVFALSPEGEVQFGGSLRVLAGESARGSLAIWVSLALRDQCGVDVRSKIAAILPSYAIFDLTYTPSMLNHKREAVLSRRGMQMFMDAAFPRVPLAERKDAKISSLYAELGGMPPAIFLCGTEDPLVDDSVFMAGRWSLWGNQAELRLVPGAWHAFTLIPAGEVTEEGVGELVRFAKRHI